MRRTAEGIKILRPGPPDGITIWSLLAALPLYQSTILLSSLNTRVDGIFRMRMFAGGNGRWFQVVCKTLDFMTVHDFSCFVKGESRVYLSWQVSLKL